ncbi:MAG: NAD-dependent epimerase/dehydratase family protein [Halioglobus sp.]
MSNILVVGGTGLTGAHCALHLRDLGNDVTIMSRSPTTLDCLGDFDHIAANYVDNAVSGNVLGKFEHMVFAAGADIRQFPPGEDEYAFYTRVNSEAIPAFFRTARDAGIETAVYIGSYYPQVVPDVIQSSIYVKSRHLADEGVRALNSDSFRVCSLNAPFILGYVDGMELPHLSVLVQYAQGLLEGIPVVAPTGGVNHISSQSMSEAIAGALLNGTGGKAYLLGDENLSWKDYLEMYFEAVGKPVELAVSTDEHPLFPDVMLYAGRNATVHYQPDDSLGYCRKNIFATIKEIVAAYK